MDSERRGSVRLSQLKLYVANHIHDKYFAPPLVVIVAALLTTWIPVWQAALWAALELLIVSVYIVVYQRFQRARPTPSDEPRWTTRISLAHGAHMLSWSSLIVWARQAGNFDNVMFLMLIHAGLISLTASMSSPHRRLLYTDLIPPAVALLIPPLLYGGWISLGLSLLGLFYLALMMFVGLGIHRGTAEALHLRQHNEELIRKLELQVTRDPLTGIANRSHFLSVGRNEIQRAARFEHSLALLMLDIDHFKPVNDGYGHLTGDEVLKEVTAACLEVLRSGDCLGRLGGEEFALLLPEIGLPGALATAERIRQNIAERRFVVPDGRLTLTVSIGVTMKTVQDEALSTMMRRADLAMYAAKNQGRNRVITLDAEADPDRLPDEASGEVVLAPQASQEF